MLLLLEFPITLSQAETLASGLPAGALGLLSLAKMKKYTSIKLRWATRWCHQPNKRNRKWKLLQTRVGLVDKHDEGKQNHSKNLANIKRSELKEL